MSTVNSEIRFAVQAPSYITSNPSKVLASGEPIFFNNGTYVFGDGVTALNALTVYGSSAAWGSITGTLSNQTDLQNALNAKQNTITTGTTAQYFRGDLSLATFPTAVSSFTNDAGYLTSSAIGVTVQGYSANTTLLGNSTTGSGSIVLATSPTFGTDITTPLVLGGSSSYGDITISPTSNANKGYIYLGSSGANNVKVRGGIQVQAGLSTDNGALTGAGFELEYNGGIAYVTAYNRTGGAWLPLNVRGSTLTFQSSNTTVIASSATGTTLTFSGAASTSGAVTNYTFNSTTNTGQTASTNIPNFRVNGSTKTWAAGTITNQYWNYFTANTAAFASASTITNSYSLFVESAIAGSNATISNNWALGLSGSLDMVSGNINLLNTTSSTTGVITKNNVRYLHNFSVSGTTGKNVFLGDESGNFTLTGSTGNQGSLNTAVGAETGKVITTGNQNCLFGYQSGSALSSGTHNVFVGNLSGTLNTSGGYNVFLGHSAGAANTTANNSVAIGASALRNANGGTNVAIGVSAGTNITSGDKNTFLGSNSGGGITTGNNNTILGSNVFGLASGLTNNIILAQGDGVVRFRYNPMASSGGMFQFTPESTTGQTASTEIPAFVVNSATTTLAAGALTTQRFAYFPTQTIAFASASTITNSYGLYVEAATAGTNATITNNYAAGFSGNVIVTGNLSTPTIYGSSSASGTLTLESTSNATKGILKIGSDTCSVRIGATANNVGNRLLRVQQDTAWMDLGSLVGGTSVPAIYFLQTAPSVSNYALAGNGTQTFLNAASSVLFTIGNVAQLTITSNTFTFKDASNLVFNDTTGTKIGTATTQKIGFWNATPIVQPTTAVTAATYAAVGGTTVQTNDTFDGYTVGQIVKALRNAGLLA